MTVHVQKSTTTQRVLWISPCVRYLQMDVQWNVLPIPLDSDHNPILLSFAAHQRKDNNCRTRNCKRADWGSFTHHRIWQDLPTAEDWSVSRLLQEFYARMKVAVEESVPSIPVTKFFSKAWWNTELAQSHKSRRQAYRKYRRRKSNKLEEATSSSSEKRSKVQTGAMAESIN